MIDESDRAGSMSLFNERILHMRLPIAVLTTCLALAGAAQSQQSGSAILVLDGSGSMWGQIEGKAKITIAQEVVGGLLKDLPADQALGLTVYGHRRKGDCSDIETLVSPGSGSRDAIGEAVAGIKPKGKTPMTDAVIAAAKALKYTENAATVILVSDGIETCAPDPCAAAKALEEAGVEFTAHVVGFDVSDPKALAQMQCMARETGGRFLTASNADELGDALTQVASAAPEEPAPTPETLPQMVITGPTEAPAGSIQTYAFEGEVGAEDFLAVYAEDGTQMVYRTVRGQPQIKLQLPKQAGAYELRYEFRGREDSVLARLPIVLGEALPSLSLQGALEAGGSVDVAWTGPGTEWDFLSIGDVDGDAGYHTASDYLSAGNPISIALPSAPGTYELRYIYGENREVIVREIITVE